MPLQRLIDKLRLEGHSKSQPSDEYAKRLELLRATLATDDPDALRAAMRKLVDDAQNGDSAAARIVLEYDAESRSE